MRNSKICRTIPLVTTVVCASLGCSQREDAHKQRLQLASASMAPRWIGPHFIATCTTCCRSASIAADAYDSLRPTRCYRCGGICTVDSEVVAGDVVEMALFPKSERPQRLDVIVGKDPLTMKRVWGLPGESIELHDGELWIDGVLFQKTLPQFAQVGVLLSSCPDDPHNHWRRHTSISEAYLPIEFEKSSNSVSLSAGEPLFFCYHYPNRDIAPPSLEPKPVVDDYIANQNSTSKLHVVDDLLLTVELLRPATTVWFVKFRVAKQSFYIDIYPAADDAIVPPVASGISESGYSLQCRSHLAVAVCDGRILASSDIENCEWDLTESLVDLRPEKGNFGAGGRRADTDAQIVLNTTSKLNIVRATVARDLWLGPRENSRGSWTNDGSATAGYFVLGDNLPISQDSRDTEFGRLNPNRVIGRIPNRPVEGWVRVLEDGQKSR